MPRSVETDPERPSHPKWLAQAEHIARIADEFEAAGASRHEFENQVQRTIGIGLPVARRLERAYRFLQREYPRCFDAPKFAASWASVLELSKLKVISSARADEVAALVFDGRMTAPRIAELAKAAVPGQRGVFAEARALLRDGPSFEQRVIQLIRDEPTLVDLGYIEDVFVPPRGDALMPDLILKQSGKTIAVEVKMVSDSPSLHTIGSHLARLAQLEQRYTLAILVFPGGAEKAVRMARELQVAWSGRTPHIVML